MTFDFDLKPYMMLKKILLFLFISLTLNLNAQVTDVATGLNRPAGIALLGNTLFFSEVNTGKIFKVDISVANPVPTLVISGMNKPTFIEVKGDFLFVAIDGGISKINHTDLIPNITSVITTNTSLGGLLFIGDDLYFSEYSPNGKISKIDVTELSPTITNIVTNLSHPSGITIYGNSMYTLEASVGRIRKFDYTISSPSLITVFNGVSSGNSLRVVNDDLFISSGNSSGKISKIDLTSPSPTRVDVVNNLNRPFDMLLEGTNVYVTEIDGDKISKLDLSTLSNKEVTKNVQFYPNPTANQFFIKTDQFIESVKVYSVQGKMIKSFLSQELYNIKELSSGVYFIKIKTSVGLITKKLIKK